MGVPSFCILACISGVNCLTSSALYEPEGIKGNLFLYICRAAMAYERDSAAGDPAETAGSTSVAKIEIVLSLLRMI